MTLFSFVEQLLMLSLFPEVGLFFKSIVATFTSTRLIFKRLCKGGMFFAKYFRIKLEIKGSEKKAIYHSCINVSAQEKVMCAKLQNCVKSKLVIRGIRRYKSTWCIEDTSPAKMT